MYCERLGPLLFSRAQLVSYYAHLGTRIPEVDMSVLSADLCFSLQKTEEERLHGMAIV